MEAETMNALYAQIMALVDALPIRDQLEVLAYALAKRSTALSEKQGSCTVAIGDKAYTIQLVEAGDAEAVVSAMLSLFHESFSLPEGGQHVVQYEISGENGQLQHYRFSIDRGTEVPLEMAPPPGADSLPD